MSLFLLVLEERKFGFLFFLSAQQRDSIRSPISAID
jgi:hypothetical protein